MQLHQSLKIHASSRAGSSSSQCFSDREILNVVCANHHVFINDSLFLCCAHTHWVDQHFFLFFHTQNTRNRQNTQANLLRPKICILLVDIYFHPRGLLTLAWQGQISDRRAAIHLMPPCWFGQTSSGKQSLQQGWAERITSLSGTSNYLTSADCG